MTPEEARGLIDGIDYDSERDMWGAFPDRYDPYTVYDMAETIADMRCEYAVEVDAPEGKAYALESDDGMTYHIANPTYADWEEDRDDMEIFATRVDRDLGTTARVVRRLVSEPEVVE